MHRRRGRGFAVAVASLATLVAVGLGACGKDGDSSAAGAASSGGPVTLRIGDQSKTLELPLTLSGEATGTSYGLNWNNFSDGPHMNAAFSAGKLDVGFMGDTPVLFANAASVGVVVVAAAESSVNSQTIFARAGSGINKPADLKGKRVALTFGTSLHGYLLNQLDSAGLTQDDITAVNVPVTSLVSTFASGEVDAVVWARQYTAAVAAQSPGSYEIETSPLPYYQVILATTDALADPARRAAVVDFVQRLSRASLWPKANPDKWVQSYYVETLKQDATASRKYFDSIPTTQYRPISDAFVESQRTQARLLAGVGQLPKSLNVDNEIDADFNAELATSFGSAGLPV